MPRAKKAQIPTGQPYGEHKRLEEASIMPVGGPVGQPIVQGNAPMQQVLQQAVAGPTPNQGGLFRPSERPQEPVTSGIAAGPGSSQVPMLERRNPTANVLEIMSARTGNPIFAQLAQRARMKGL